LRARGLWSVVADAWNLAENEPCGDASGGEFRGDAPAEAVLEHVGRRLGCLVAGGSVNRELAGRRLVDSFAAGKLGPVTLELPGEPLTPAREEIPSAPTGAP
jgi:ribosome biogenesis GTPase A